MKKYFIVILLLISSVSFSQTVQQRLGIDSASGNVHLYNDTIISLPNLPNMWLNGYGSFYNLRDTVRTYFSMTNLTGYNTYTGTTGVINIHPSVDTITRTVGKDSICFTIDGRSHCVLDSAGGGGGGITGSGVYNRIPIWSGTSSLYSDTSFRYNPSSTATNGIARGFHISPFLKANTSSDTLAAIYISPKYDTTAAGARFKQLAGYFNRGLLIAGSYDTLGTEIGMRLFPRDTLNDLISLSLYHPKSTGKDWQLRSSPSGIFSFTNATPSTPISSININGSNQVIFGNSTSVLNGSLVTVQGDASIAGGFNINGTLAVANGVGFQMFYDGAEACIDAANRNSGGFTRIPMRVRTSGMSVANNELPDASAMLDVISTGKGFRAPVMSTTNKNAIASPATGLLVYDSTMHWYGSYNKVSGKWVSVNGVVASADSTGQTAAGNIVTYTTGAADGSFDISGYINVTAITTDVLQFQVSYTDVSNTARTVTVGSDVSAPGDYSFDLKEIRCKAATTLTVKTNQLTGGGSESFYAGGTITQIR